MNQVKLGGLSFLLLMSGIFSGLAESQEWNRFRGPNGTGVDMSQPLPVSLDEQTTIWHNKLAGKGHSSPIIVGDQVLVSSWNEDGQILLESFLLDNGEPGWTWKNPLLRSKMHRLNSPAASTPAADSKRAYLLAMEPGHLRLFAIELENGELAWERDFGEWQAQHGFATSPIVVDDKVILVNSQETVSMRPSVPSEMISVSTTSGQDIWRRKLMDGKAAYSVPLVIGGENEEVVIIGSSTAEGIYATSGKDGSELWSTAALPERTVGSAVVCGESVLATCGSGGGGKLMVGVTLDSGNHPFDLEFHENLGYVPTPLVLEDRIYVFADNGVVSCIDWSSGEYLWRERVCDSFWGSPVSDGRHLYCIDAAGVVHILPVGDSFSGAKKFSLGEASSSTPAIADGRILIRSESQLWCFGAR